MSDLTERYERLAAESPTLHNELKAKAEAEERSLSATIRFAVIQ